MGYDGNWDYVIRMVFGFVVFGQRILGCCRDGVDLTRVFLPIGITLSEWFLVSLRLVREFLGVVGTGLT
jgi:hypothetical protein